jgi:hypothetical protein
VRAGGAVSRLLVKSASRGLNACDGDAKQASRRSQSAWTSDVISLTDAFASPNSIAVFSS